MPAKVKLLVVRSRVSTFFGVSFQLTYGTPHPLPSDSHRYMCRLTPKVYRARAWKTLPGRLLCATFRGPLDVVGKCCVPVFSRV